MTLAIWLAIGTRTSWYTLWSVSIISPKGLSTLYLTLFQWKDLRYCSAGSGALYQQPETIYEVQESD